MRTITQTQCFGGVQGYYQHDSAAIGLPMKFSVYKPPQALQGPVPVLFFLAGLTCTEETFMIKAGAQRYAAEHGLMLVAPDTSPRNTGIASVADNWDFGDGAGFYLDATEAPWSQRFRMESYLVQDLLPLIMAEFPARAGDVGIFGHSMGGHGALTLALRHPDLFRSVSALAPIAAPMQSPWGQKAFGLYLGADRETWREHDACELMAERTSPLTSGILIDQGLNDQFLRQKQLLPELFEAACEKAGQPLSLRRHAGYDHGYYFIATVMHDHLAFHAEQLK
ncbi:MAG TPA: S-formylglutathione hydrolase [Herbaspirillum sp.]|jgi:S-formylglutathione hydrolase